MHIKLIHTVMKKIVMIAAALSLFASAELSAQNYKAGRVTLSDSPSAPAYALPYTTVKVYLTVDKQVVRSGPYARYAQKYLGVIAPLVDKETYLLRDVRLDYTDPDRMVLLNPETRIVETGIKPVSHRDGGGDFTKAQPDRMSAIERSVEDQAREAANTIFTLRKRRFDLVSGEAGEHVYGEGMKAAIEEMARMEEEYLSLFLGKQSIETTVHEYDVVPQSDKVNYVVCRFSPEEGVLPESNLSAKPIVLACAPERSVLPSPAKGGAKGVELFRVADFVDCRLTFESDELDRKRIPIYQYGATVVVPAGAGNTK